MTTQKLIGRQVTKDANGHVQNHSDIQGLDWWISAMSNRFMPNFQLNQGYIRPFIEEWLRNLESKQNPAWVAAHLQDLVDIDLTTDEMLPKIIRQMAPEIDLSRVDIDLRFLLKNIRHVLAHRGSVEGICFLFALLGDDVEIFTPSDWMLGASDHSYVSAQFKITDGVYYTPFTYDIKSHIDPNVWWDFIRSVCHPHGSIMYGTIVHDSTAPQVETPVQDSTTESLLFDTMIHRRFGSPMGGTAIGEEFLREVCIDVGAGITGTWINNRIDTDTPISDWDATKVGHLAQQSPGTGRGIIRGIKGSVLFIEEAQEFSKPPSVGKITEVVDNSRIKVTGASNINASEYIMVRGTSHRVTAKSGDQLTLNTSAMVASMIDEHVYRGFEVSFGDGSTAGNNRTYPTHIYMRSPWTQQILEGLDHIVLSELEDESLLGDQPLSGISTDIIYS